MKREGFSSTNRPSADWIVDNAKDSFDIYSQNLVVYTLLSYDHLEDRKGFENLGIDEEDDKSKYMFSCLSLEVRESYNPNGQVTIDYSIDQSTETYLSNFNKYFWEMEDFTSINGYKDIEGINDKMKEYKQFFLEKYDLSAEIGFQPEWVMENVDRLYELYKSDELFKVIMDNSWHIIYMESEDE